MQAPIAMMYSVGDPFEDRWVWYRTGMGRRFRFGVAFVLFDLTGNRFVLPFDAADAGL